MDPLATLDRAEEAMREKDFPTAWEYLRHYWEWRDNGGYEPPKGDKRAHCIADSSNYGD
jgi:hypothetical protein